MAETKKIYIKDEKDLPREPFTESTMILVWNKFVEKLMSNGQRIMASYMQINTPTLLGTIIKLELPNEGSKIDFDTKKHDLLGYLRSKLYNYDITIEVTVNEIVESKYVFTSQEKYDKLKNINPLLDMLKRTFDLDY